MVSSKSRWFSPSYRMVVCIPSGSTEVEIRAVRDSSEHAEGRDVYMIYEPMAAALGIGLDVEAPEGNMIVDIGGGTTEIAVISLGGIVTNKSIRIAGDVLTDDIQEHMRRAHNVKVGERMAELIKINVGSALTELENPPEDYIIHGPNQMTALPMEVPVSYQEISHCIEKSISKLRQPSSVHWKILLLNSMPTLFTTAFICQVAVPCCVVWTNVCRRKSVSSLQLRKIRCMQ